MEGFILAKGKVCTLLIRPTQFGGYQMTLAISFYLIRTIPVHVDMEDAVGWHFDSKGRSSVKSAYKVHRMVESMISPRGGAGAVEMKEKLISGENYES